MLDTLLASRARGERRTGGTLVSILLHSGAIALVLVSTARATRPPREPAPPKVIYTASPRPAKPLHDRRAPRGGAPTHPTIDVSGIRPPVIGPVVIPKSLPPSDLSKALTDERLFDRGSSALPTQSGGGGEGAPIGGDGVWLAPQVEKPVMGRPDNPRPRYPESLRAAHVEGSVLARFVVDSSGRVEPGSIVLGDATHALFAEAVRDALLRSRFVPAEVGGRHVRQLVEQRFLFALDR